MNMGKDFLNVVQKILVMKGKKIDRLHPINMTNFCVVLRE